MADSAPLANSSHNRTSSRAFPNQTSVEHKGKRASLSELNKGPTYEVNRDAHPNLFFTQNLVFLLNRFLS